MLCRINNGCGFPKFFFYLFALFDRLQHESQFPMLCAVMDVDFKHFSWKNHKSHSPIQTSKSSTWVIFCSKFSVEISAQHQIHTCLFSVLTLLYIGVPKKKKKKGWLWILMVKELLSRAYVRDYVLNSWKQVPVLGLKPTLARPVPCIVPICFTYCLQLHYGHIS